MSGLAPFSPGVRPFFLGAGLTAVVVMTVWLLGYTKRDPLLTYYGSSGWHAHEMLFGYMTAAIGGILLAMVHDPTNGRAPGGMPLLALAALWVAGRVLPLLQDVPPWLVAAVDLLFLPAFAAVLAAPLLRTSRRQELFMVALLLVLSVANALVHGEWLGYAMDSARLGIVLAMYVMVLLLTVIAGRVIPAFIKGAALQARPVVEYAAAIAVIALACADLFAPTVQTVTVCAIVAAGVHAWRWSGWAVKVDWSRALSWALMAGYGWLIVGFVLTAASYGGLIPHMLAFHAYMVGGFGGLTLGIMAHVAMGRDGRPMRVPPMAVVAFAILNIAAVVRIVGPLSSVRYAQATIVAAGALWIVCYVLYLLVYAPLLAQRRSDVSSRPEASER